MEWTGLRMASAAAESLWRDKPARQGRWTEWTGADARGRRPNLRRPTVLAFPLLTMPY